MSDQTDILKSALEKELQEAETKAIDSLSRYKFQMFGYWAGIWVHLNKMMINPKPNPFRKLVLTARDIKKEKRGQ